MDIGLMSQKLEFDILSLIELAREKKYERTVAGFAILDKLEKIPLPKKVRAQKPSIQAIYALANDIIKYDYFTKEQKEELIKEATKSDAPYKKFSGLFGASSAPVIEEDTEEEYIPEEESKSPSFVDEDTGFEEEFVDDRYSADSMEVVDEDEDDIDEEIEDDSDED